MTKKQKVVRRRTHTSRANRRTMKRPRSVVPSNVAHVSEAAAPVMTAGIASSSIPGVSVPESNNLPSLEMMEGYTGIYSISTQTLLNHNINRYNLTTEGVKKQVTSRNGIRFACVVPESAKNHPGRIADKIVNNAVIRGILHKAIQQLTIASTEEGVSPVRARRLQTNLAVVSAAANILAERNPTQAVQAASLIKPIQLALADSTNRGLSRSTLFPLLTNAISGKSVVPPKIQRVPKGGWRPLHTCEHLLEATNKYLQLRYTDKALHELRYKHILPKPHQRALLSAREYASLRKAYNDFYNTTTIAASDGVHNNDENATPIFEASVKDDRFPVFRLAVVHVQALWTIEQRGVITAWQTQNRDPVEEFKVVVVDSDAAVRAALSKREESVNPGADCARVAIPINSATVQKNVAELHDFIPSDGVDDETSAEDSIEELSEVTEHVCGPGTSINVEESVVTGNANTPQLGEISHQFAESELLDTSHGDVSAETIGASGLKSDTTTASGTETQQDVTPPRCIVSKTTVLRCLHAWGYANISSNAAILDDAHERPETVVDRELFIEKLLLVQHRIIKVYSPENWMLIREKKAGEPFSRLEQAALGVDLGTGESPLLLVYHDEAAISTNPDDASCCHQPVKQGNPDEPTEEGPGPAVSVSAFLSGFGTHSVRLLQSSTYIGQHSLEQMVDHTKEAMAALKQEYPAICPLVLFNNTDRNNEFADNALQASKMSKSDGDTPTPRRKTYWPLDAQGNALPGAVECSMKVKMRGKLVSMGLLTLVTLRSNCLRDGQGRLYSSYTEEQLRAVVDGYADFKHAQPAVIEAVMACGGLATFIPRLHSELNACGALWEHVKAQISLLGDRKPSMLVQDIVRHVYPPIIVSAQWLKQTSTHLLAYAIGLPGAVTLPWANAIAELSRHAVGKHPLDSDGMADVTSALSFPPFCNAFLAAIGPAQDETWQRSDKARVAVLNCVEEIAGLPHAGDAVAKWLERGNRRMLHVVEPTDPTVKPHTAPSSVLMPLVPLHHAITYMSPNNLQQWATSGETFAFSADDWAAFQQRRTASVNKQMAELRLTLMLQCTTNCGGTL